MLLPAYSIWYSFSIWICNKAAGGWDLFAVFLCLHPSFVVLWHTDCVLLCTSMWDGLLPTCLIIPEGSFAPIILSCVLNSPLPPVSYWTGFAVPTSTYHGMLSTASTRLSAHVILPFCIKQIAPLGSSSSKSDPWLWKPKQCLQHQLMSWLLIFNMPALLSRPSPSLARSRRSCLKCYVSKL